MYFTEQENLLIFENKYYPLIVRSTATKKNIVEVTSVYYVEGSESPFYVCLIVATATDQQKYVFFFFTQMNS